VVRELDPDRLGDHIDRLFRAAWALTGSPADAEDLVQETYVRVLAKRRVLRSDDELGYLLTVLRNTFFETHQKRQRAPSPADPADFHEVEDRRSPGAHEALEAREVYAVVQGLPDAHRDVVVAVDVVGLSYKETAKALDVRIGTVMSRLSRGRDQVAKALGA
jgi:RNA polymerase sigma-70 factor (ECF subfamily)